MLTLTLYLYFFFTGKVEWKPDLALYLALFDIIIASMVSEISLVEISK